MSIQEIFSIGFLKNLCTKSEHLDKIRILGKFQWCILIVLLVLFVTSTTPLALAAQQTAPVFQADVHPSTLEYLAYYESYTARTDMFILSIQTDLYDKDTAIALWNIVKTDMAFITQKISAKFIVPTVYVVKSTLHGIQPIGNCVYCTPDDILDGRYREALVTAMYDYSDAWLAVGATAYAFGECADSNALREYYTYAKDVNLLSLFAAYFVEDFATGEELALARSTAVSLYAYGIEKYGSESLMKKNRVILRQGWLKHIGVDRIYDDPYPFVFDDYLFNTHTSSSQYPLIVKTARKDVIFITKQNMSELSTPMDIMRFLFESHQGMQAVIDIIAAQAPDCLQYILNNYDEPITYYCGSDISCCCIQSRKVYLRDGMGAFVHETMHVIFQAADTSIERWKFEALNEYIANKFAPTEYRTKILYTWMMCDEVGADKYAEYYEKVREIYLEHAKCPQSVDDFDALLFFISAGDCVIRYPSIHPLPYNAITSISRKHSSGQTKYPSSNGNELSTYEAISFANYLIDNFSLNTFIRYCLDNTSFEASFGKDYNELKNEWIAFVLQDSK